MPCDTFETFDMLIETISAFTLVRQAVALFIGKVILLWITCLLLAVIAKELVNKKSIRVSGTPIVNPAPSSGKKYYPLPGVVCEVTEHENYRIACSGVLKDHLNC